MESFENNLHRAIIELKDISPKEGLWEEIEQQLDFEKSIANKTNELPLHMPKEDLWSSIDTELNREKRSILVWWRWAAVFFFVSGIVFILVKNEGQNEPRLAQTLSEDKHARINQKEKQSTQEYVEVQKSKFIDDSEKREFSDNSKIQVEPSFKLMYLASKSPRTIIEKPKLADLEIKIIEIKQAEQRPHYREVEIVFEQNLRKRKRREPTELDNLIEQKYLEKIEQGRIVFVEPVFAMKIGDKETVEGELFK